MRSLCAVLAVLGVAATSCSKEPPPAPAPENQPTATAQQGVAGNIAPGAIQIDEGGPGDGDDGADLYADLGSPANDGALLDWVLDADDNVGTGCLDPITSIAECVEEGVTGAVGGTGHWNGIRIVDGIAGADQDIFLTGGKENDVSTWNIGPGTIGASKSDLTQAYLANNQTNLFFAMERRANNGTTAFDFEFNQVAPGTGECPDNALIPCRTEDDVLFTFEMQGSGNSGSAVPHVYLWDPDAGAYDEVDTLPEGVFSSINEVATPAGPWGRVDSGGDWTLDDFLRFELAEATAPLTVLSGVDECGGTAYVQVRTRSSATANSDLKDTSKIFEFQFNSVTADATLTGSCDGTATYSVAAEDPSGTPIPAQNLNCAWDFTPDIAGEPLTGCNGSLSAAQLEGISSLSATVTVTWGAAGAECGATDAAGPVDILQPIEVTIAPTSDGAECKDPDDAPNDYSDIEQPPGTVITYEATVTGGDGEYTYDWNIDGCGDDDSCDVSDPGLCADLPVYVTVDDGSDCGSDTSETERYTKITFVTSVEASGEGGGGAGGGGAGGG